MGQPNMTSMITYKHCFAVCDFSHIIEESCQQYMQTKFHTSYACFACPIYPAKKIHYAQLEMFITFSYWTIQCHLHHDLLLCSRHFRTQNSIAFRYLSFNSCTIKLKQTHHMFTLYHGQGRLQLSFERMTASKWFLISLTYLLICCCDKLCHS